MNIYILTGSVQSGKTTQLTAYCREHNTLAGILSPVIEGKRYFLNIVTQEMKLMEAIANEEKTVNIGKYSFSLAAFEWANKNLMDISLKYQDMIIIDEVGPLELQGKGLTPALNYLFSLPELKSDLLLIVREGKVEEVMEYFGLKDRNVRIIINVSQLP